MKINQILEYRDMCNVCGQTPCNCTHIAEDAEPMDREFALVKKLGRLGERIVQNPRLWDRYDDAIDTENTDWVIGLIQDGTGATADEVTKLADLFGEIGGGLGRLTDFAWAVKQGTWDKDFMNPYRAHRSQDLNEFARDDDGRDDGGEDPYKYPKPQHYERSIDFFGRFEADHFDDEEFDKAAGVFKGYWDDEQGRDQIAYFKFDNPQRTSDDDPGMGWYYEPQNESINEFAPPGGDDREPDEEEILHRLASQWWTGTEQDMIRAERTLASMGWEIGEDEGYDDGGVFVVRAGDENGKSYISWPHEDLQLDEGQRMGEYGRVLSALGLYVPDKFSMEELNTPDWHRVIANKADVPVEYAGKVIDDFTRPVDGHDDDEWPEDDDENVAEGAGNIGSAIKSLYQKIYAAGDDEIEYFYNASPIFAQYWDEYEGDLDSIIAEVDPSELEVIKAELESYVDDANLAEGKPKEKEADYGADYQDMVARVKKLAGLGPLKTVWDPQKRVYKNVPRAVQPGENK